MGNQEIPTVAIHGQSLQQCEFQIGASKSYWARSNSGSRLLVRQHVAKDQQQLNERLNSLVKRAARRSQRLMVISKVLRAERRQICSQQLSLLVVSQQLQGNLTSRIKECTSKGSQFSTWDCWKVFTQAVQSMADLLGELLQFQVSSDTLWLTSNGYKIADSQFLLTNSTRQYYEVRLQTLQNVPASPKQLRQLGIVVKQCLDNVRSRIEHNKDFFDLSMIANALVSEPPLDLGGCLAAIRAKNQTQSEQHSSYQSTVERHYQPARQFSYAGGLKNGQYHGLGQLVNPHSNGIKVTLQTVGLDSSKAFKVYKGQFVEGHITGFGMMQFEGGDTLVGNFADGLVHGLATFESSGSKTMRTWKHGVLMPFDQM